MVEIPKFDFLHQTSYVADLLAAAEAALEHLPAEKQARLAAEMREFERISVFSYWDLSDVEDVETECESENEQDPLTTDERRAVLHRFESFRTSGADVDFLRLRLARDAVLAERDDPNRPEPALRPFRVSIYKRTRQGLAPPIHFDCEATDAFDAQQQANKIHITSEIAGAERLYSEPYRYLVYSENERHSGDGACFWHDPRGWVPFERATRFCEYGVSRMRLPTAIGNDARWVTAAEAETLAQAPLNTEQRMSVSLDGGGQFRNAPDGVRVIYHGLPIPGEDSDGELRLNVTPEGLILDVWTSREAHLGHNIGTSSEMAAEIVSRLVQDNQ